MSGADIGGMNTKIGLVDVHRKAIRTVTIPAGAERHNPHRTAEEMLEEIGRTIRELLEEEGIPLDQCAGVGVGVAGTVERKSGTVRYSNNLRWENVKVAEELGRQLPLPVQVANNGDCAALGEALAGAGREYRDVVMLTVGAGVGSGIIRNEEIYEGPKTGGTELGHMVILENGEPCTCGRRGCLEAYVSVPALKRDAERATGREMEAEEIFAAAAAGDARLREVADTYLRRLGVGIVNIVNIFRPQAVIIGGDIPFREEELVPPLEKAVRESCFGGEKGDLPDIKAAALGSEAGVIGAAGLL